jgi:uncharacterized protein (TIGR01777 family)
VNTQKSKPKKIILAGGSGFIGDSIINYFSGKDAQFIILTRTPKMDRKNVRHIAWDGKNLGTWVSEFENADAVINLTGRTVNCRYNKKNKKEILDSRVNSTKCIGEAIRQCKNPPALWINSASATIYRHAQDGAMDEDTGEYGKGFSVEVCRAWEKCFNDISTPLTRKILLRIAIVLGKDAGVMKPMTRLVRLGLGGRMGNGRQMFSWIHEKDLVSLVEWLIEHEEVSGTFNCVAPNPLPNAQLMRLLRNACGIPWGLPQPKWMLEFGALLISTETELILKSRWVMPKRLLDLGFQFQFETAEQAIHDLLAEKPVAGEAEP